MYIVVDKFNKTIAPAIVFSIISGLFIYMFMGGTIWCPEVVPVAPVAPVAPV
jgi:hypothetical protein